MLTAMSADLDVEPEVVWQPDPSRVSRSRISGFREWLHSRDMVEEHDYDTLWRWSVDDPGAFWDAVARYFDVTFHDQPTAALAEASMPGAQWFPGATLNFAEHALRPGAGKDDADEAVVFRAESGVRVVLTYADLRRRVAAVRAGLVELGVGRGDRVAAFVGNTPQALIALLATASLGAVWSSCSPDFGARAVADRFTQIEPKVLIATGGYSYGGRYFDVSATVDAVREQLPGLAATIMVPSAATDD